MTAPVDRPLPVALLRLAADPRLLRAAGVVGTLAVAVVVVLGVLAVATSDRRAVAGAVAALGVGCLCAGHVLLHGRRATVPALLLGAAGLVLVAAAAIGPVGVAGS